MSWILVFMMWAPHGFAADHIEFASRASCEAARVAIVRAFEPGGFGSGESIKAVCVERPA